MGLPHAAIVFPAKLPTVKRPHAFYALLLAAACRTAGVPATSPAPMTVPEMTPRAMALYRGAFVIDMHDDMPSKVLDEAYDADIRNAPGFGPHQGHTDLPRLVESGVTATFMSAWVDAPYAHIPGASFLRAQQYLSVIHSFAERHPDRLLFATTAADVRRLGMLVDLSHVSDSTFFDAVKVSTAPVIASHSSARALSDVPRNLTDEQLRAVAKTGGVVNVNFYSRFIDPVYRARIEEVERTILAERNVARARGEDSASMRTRLRAMRESLASRIPPTPFHVLIEHIEHVARVAGVDHVGIGSDFNGVAALPDGLEDVTRLPRIAQALLDRGWPEGDVQKILGGNMLRVMEQVLR